jgi:bacterial/archaeal transporter family-2 protein
VAALVALIAVIVSAVSAADASLHLSWVVLLAVSAGFGISVQQAINGRVSAATGQPIAATLVNFVVGFSALALATTAGLALGALHIDQWPSQWWLYVGGPIGVLFIALAAWAVRGVGVLVFGLLTIAGQLTGSVLLDTLLPTGTAALAWPQWIGLLLIAIAVLLAAVPNRGARSGKMVR